MRPLARASLSSIAARVVVGGVVLGISNTAVTPPRMAARLPRVQVFLVRVAGLAEMDLGVHDAGQDMQALGLEHLRRLGVGKAADGGDAAADNPDIGGGNAIGGGDHARRGSEDRNFPSWD